MSSNSVLQLMMVLIVLGSCPSDIQARSALAEIRNENRKESFPKSAGNGSKKVAVLIVTGGHAFEEDAFFQSFRDMKQITWLHARFGHGAEEKLNAHAFREYDVAVFYDVHQNHRTHAEGMLELLKEGKGMVFLHHTLFSYEEWEAYPKIIGGRASSKKIVEVGSQEVSGVKDDVTYRVHIADRSHPILMGLDDFDITDEVYHHFAVNPDVKVLLTTDHPDSG